MLKRILSSGLLGLLLLTAVSAPLTAQAAGGSGVQVSFATSAFTPENNQYASISYAVRGPDAASNVAVKIYESYAAPAGRVCNDTIPAKFVKLIDSHSSLSVGTYIATWSGLNAANLPYPAGNYCYTLRWTNPASGYTGLAEGLIALNSRNPVPTPTPTTTPTTTTTQPSSADITHYVNPATIDPAAGQSTTIYYTVNRRLTTGLELTVMDSSNHLVARPFSSNATVEANTYSQPWNGKYSNGTIIAGTYRYIFTSAGTQIGQGNIYVVEQTYNPNQGNFIINSNASPSEFRPNNGETTTINYTVGKTVSNFRLTVRNQNGSLSRELVPSMTRTSGSYSQVWDGKFNGIVPATDTYTYVLEAYNETPVTGTVRLVTDTVNPPYGSVPVINDLGPTRTIIDPYATDSSVMTTSIRYTVDQNAQVDVTILNSNMQTIRRLLTSYNSTNVTANSLQTVLWDGRDSSNNIVADATYTYYIEARNSNGAAATRIGTITVAPISRNGNPYNPPYSTMDVYNLSVTPNPFNPDNQSTNLSFSLNQQAMVTVTVTNSNGSFVKTLASNQNYGSGSTNISWNGTDSSGSIVPTGTYNFRVDASNSTYGYDSATASVSVSRYGYSNSGAIQIIDAGATPNPFNPRAGQITRINFSVNVAPTSVSVKLYRANGDTFVRDLIVQNLGSNQYRVEWNGQDNYNQYVSDASYIYKIDVYAQGQYSQRTNTIYVNQSATGYANCGNFVDVKAKDKYLCDALEFVRTRGIFAGYNDATVGMDRVIERAELLAVMQKAFGFSLDSYNPNYDGDLGYKDLGNSTYEWYMPYLKTFKRLQVMVGYPDRTVRPGKTMNTAELFLVFLKGAIKAPGNVTHYTIPSLSSVDEAPYIDTPINNNTSWYIRYAEFAKIHDLVTTTRFYPEKGITRGQVIKLIYETNRKGLISYGPPLVTYYNSGNYNYDNNNSWYDTNNNTNSTSTVDVYNLAVSPSTFNPENQSTNLSFSLNRSAITTITITNSNGSFVKTLTANHSYGSGSKNITWNGTDSNGNLVASGTYNFRIEARNSTYGSDSATASVYVTRNGYNNSSSSSSSMDVYNLTVNPSTFNPETQSTTFSFYLNRQASTTITVTNSNGSFVKTLVSNQSYGSGSTSINWNGTDSNGSLVASGTYNLRVDATNSTYGSDSATATIYVSRNGSSSSSTTDVYNLSATPNTFNPGIQSTTLSFSLNQQSTVTVTVTNSNGSFVKTLVSNQSYISGPTSIIWNGTDSNGALVNSGTYNFRVDATNYTVNGSDSETTTVYVTR